MLSASLRKSVTDLTRRRARTSFTVATLALAVASISFLAIPALIDRAMQAEVRAGRLADATVTMRPLELTDAQLADLSSLPNVAAVEPSMRVDARVLVGERRAPALVIGVRDFARQESTSCASTRASSPARRGADGGAERERRRLRRRHGRHGDGRRRRCGADHRRGAQHAGRGGGPGRERDRPLRDVRHGRGAERRARLRPARHPPARPGSRCRRRSRASAATSTRCRASPASPACPSCVRPVTGPARRRRRRSPTCSA